MVLVICIFFCSIETNAQQWNWHGNSHDQTIAYYTWGVIKKMKTNYNCSAYNYGKSAYQVVDVYSYSVDQHRIRINFSFSWQIDFIFMSSQEYSFTVSVSTTSSGCNTKISYDSASGNPSCAMTTGCYMYDLGCVFGE